MVLTLSRLQWCRSTNAKRLFADQETEVNASHLWQSVRLAFHPSKPAVSCAYPQSGLRSSVKCGAATSLKEGVSSFVVVLSANLRPESSRRDNEAERVIGDVGVVRTIRLLLTGLRQC